MDGNEDMLYWVWLADNCGAGSSVGKTLLAHFGSPEEIYRQKPEDVASWDFLSVGEREKVGDLLQKRSTDAAKQILADCRRKDIHMIRLTDAIYPQTLRDLSNAPLLLYCKGKFPWIDGRLTTAVVGTRTMSDYGREMAYKLGYGLAAGGALVVSGMALGVDSMAMMGALDAGGSTIAVLGSGVDVIYPKEHTQVYQRILAAGGCIVSEYIPGTRPAGRNFPIRNRIISGLSDCGIVVEGNSTSGSLITARHLVYQGKKVFAVPGQVGQEGSEGPNELIRSGALPVLTAEDVLSEFEYIYPNSVFTHAAHRAYRTLDVGRQSQETMRQSGVQVRNTRNFVGEGTYGGRSYTTPYPDLPPDPSTMPDTENVKGKVESWLHEESVQEIEQRPASKKTRSRPEGSPVGEREKTARTTGDPLTSEPLTSDSLTSEPLTSEPLTSEKKKRSVLDKLGIRLPESAEDRKKGKKSKEFTPTPEKLQPERKIDTKALAEKEMRVYNRMKPNVPVTADELVAAGGFSIGEVLAAMTVLEMAGAIEAGSGGYFLRTDPDDMPVTLVDDTEIEGYNNR